MRLVWKWLIVSIGGGLLITVSLFFSDTAESFVGPDVPRPIERIGTVVFWPVSVCMYLSGPGPTIRTSRETLARGNPCSIFCLRDRNRSFVGLLFQLGVPHSLAPQAGKKRGTSRGNRQTREGVEGLTRNGKGGLRAAEGCGSCPKRAAGVRG